LAVVCAEESDPPLFATSNRCVPVKNTLSWSAVFCARTAIQLFYVVFCVVTAVHKFAFRLVTNYTPNKWRPVESRAVIDSYIRQDLYIFPRSSSWALRDSTHAARRSWLGHCATSRKVAGSIPDGVIGIFHRHDPAALWPWGWLSL